LESARHGQPLLLVRSNEVFGRHGNLRQ